MENLAVLGEAAIICAGGIVITYEALKRLLPGEGVPFEAAWYIFAVTAAAIAIDASRVVIPLRAARKYDLHTGRAQGEAACQQARAELEDDQYRGGGDGGKGGAPLFAVHAKLCILRLSSA